MSFRNKLHVCTVNPLTCLIGTNRENTSFTKETNGKAITTELTAESGTYSVYVHLCSVCKFVCEDLFLHARHALLNYWYFHADIDDYMLVSGQGTISRHAYGGCLLETSYMYMFALLIH